MPSAPFPTSYQYEYPVALPASQSSDLAFSQKASNHTGAFAQQPSAPSYDYSPDSNASGPRFLSGLNYNRSPESYSASPIVTEVKSQTGGDVTALELVSDQLEAMRRELMKD